MYCTVVVKGQQQSKPNHVTGNECRTTESGTAEMRQRLEERLATLKGEYDKGQTRIRQLDGELTSLRETMLRISGAILVLQELLAPATGGPSDPANASAVTTGHAEPSTSAGNDRHGAANKEDGSWVHGR